MKLTPEQYAFLTKAIQANRVSRKQGQSHIEAWDVRRHLIRIFGFGGFDIETLRCDLVREIETKQGDRSRWTIVYRAEVRLTVKATDGSVLARYEDGATGDAINQPSIGDAHDFAMKTALSQALKRCAVNLGDAFGLALYNGGNPDAVVLASLVHPPASDAPAAPALPQDDAPVLPEPGTEPEPEPEPEPRPVVQQPAAPQPTDDKVGQDQHRHMHALWREIGYGGNDHRSTRLNITARILGVPSLDSSAEMTREQADKVIAALRDRKRQIQQSTQEGQAA